MFYDKVIVPNVAEQMKQGGSLHWLLYYVKKHDDLDLVISSIDHFSVINVCRGLEHLACFFMEPFPSKTTIEEKRKRLESKGRDDWFYGNHKKAYYKTAFSRMYGLFGRTDSDFVILNQDDSVEYENEREREKLLTPLQDEYQELRQFIGEKKPKAYGFIGRDKDNWVYRRQLNGEEFDFLAVNKNGDILLITLEYGTDSSAIYQSPLKMGLSFDAFKQFLNLKGKDYLQGALTDILKQKQELGILNPNRQMPKLSGNVIPVLIISEPDPKRSAPKKLREILDICRVKRGDDFLKDLRIYGFELSLKSMFQDPNLPLL